ncbi:MAG: hypothetical protein JXR94_01110, partial [Candidatus Hydrogenedentes bacterium]|nr:hypothetical protein [Candidatus Hydrogenedentota bacterium]
MLFVNHRRPLGAIVSCLLLTVAMIGPAAAEGYRTSVGDGADEIAVVVVKGSPYEMGRSLGELVKDDAKALLTSFATLASALSDEYTDQALDAAWDAVSPYTNQRFKDELRGFAEGAGIDEATVRRVHMIPVVSSYACSGVAAWGPATKDGHLYQIRNLDYTMGGGLQDYPLVVVYLPD